MFRNIMACCAGMLLVAFAVRANAHDTWVETNTALMRVGDRVEIDLKLGNHGNEHRDFKLASKVNPESLALEVIAPSGKRFDLKPELVDLGYTPKEGYWSAPFVTNEAGHHLVLSTGDSVVNHGKPQRSVRSAKALWLSSKSLDKPEAEGDAFKKPRDLPFELVLLTDPVLFAGPGKAIEVQLLRAGQGVADHVVSFVPRGVELKEGFDATYERRTNSEGKASFTPREGGVYLIVSHLLLEERGDTYESIKYAATLTLRVPQLCPCCEE